MFELPRIHLHISSARNLKANAVDALEQVQRATFHRFFLRAVTQPPPIVLFSRGAISSSTFCSQSIFMENIFP